MDGAPSGAVAGVMIRATTLVGSMHHFLGRRNDGQLVWIRRNSTGKSTSLALGGAAGVPVWVRLVRTGATITAYRGSDGVTWTKVNNAKITIPTTVTAGLAVSSGSATTRTSASFTGVQIVP
jgi:regulation of enolase protein 1 (concanavalin A-like superfamily)